MLTFKSSLNFFSEFWSVSVQGQKGQGDVIDISFEVWLTKKSWFYDTEYVVSNFWNAELLNCF